MAEMIKKHIKVPLIRNSNNGQINLSIPKKQLSEELRKKLKRSNFARVWLEDFY